MVTFNYNSEGKSITAVFAGRMDYLAVLELTPILESEPTLKNRNPEEHLIFDIAEVNYISSSFIRICVIYSKMAGPDKFSIANCQPLVKKIFKISGLDEFLKIS